MPTLIDTPQPGSRAAPGRPGEWTLRDMVALKRELDATAAGARL